MSCSDLTMVGGCQFGSYIMAVKTWVATPGSVRVNWFRSNQIMKIARDAPQPGCSSACLGLAVANGVRNWARWGVWGQVCVGTSFHPQPININVVPRLPTKNPYISTFHFGQKWDQKTSVLISDKMGVTQVKRVQYPRQVCTCRSTRLVSLATHASVWLSRHIGTYIAAAVSCICVRHNYLIRRGRFYQTCQ